MVDAIGDSNLIYATRCWPPSSMVSWAFVVLPLRSKWISTIKADRQIDNFAYNRNEDDNRSSIALVRHW